MFMNNWTREFSAMTCSGLDPLILYCSLLNLFKRMQIDLCYGNHHPTGWRIAKLIFCWKKQAAVFMTLYVVNILVRASTTTMLAQDQQFPEPVVATVAYLTENFPLSQLAIDSWDQILRNLVAMFLPYSVSSMVISCTNLVLPTCLVFISRKFIGEKFDYIKRDAYSR